jgi:hypothetical protein
MMVLPRELAGPVAVPTNGTFRCLLPNAHSVRELCWRRLGLER